MLLDELVVDPEALAARTGWTVKDDGACKADVCVPLQDDARTGDGRIDVRVLANRLGMPLVADEEHGIWALGPETAVTGAMSCSSKMSQGSPISPACRIWSTPLNNSGTFGSR